MGKEDVTGGEVKGTRLKSLDVLRGFDMLFLMGLNMVILALCAESPKCWLAQQMFHPRWQGFTQRDLIFPLFLFIAGMSFPFSYASQRERGLSTLRICGRIGRRFLILLALGLFYNGVLSMSPARVCWGSVLGSIGFAWAVAAILYVFVGWKPRLLIAFAIVIAYAIVLRTFEAPPEPRLSRAALRELAGGVQPAMYSFTLKGNIAGWIDRLVFANAARSYYGQGILGHVSAIATAMFGMLTGEFVRSSRFGGNLKSLLMALVGVVLAAAGYAANATGYVPIIKRLWSPSFVLVTAGWSLFLFALFYWLIDVRRWWRWTGAFQAVGMNAITIYMLKPFINFDKLGKYFSYPFYAYGTKYWGNVATAAISFALAWALLWFLYKRKVFLKV